MDSNIKPTKKQYDFVISISNKLDIKLPKYTKTAYSKFISENIEEFNKCKNGKHWYFDDMESNEMFGCMGELL